jgi:hypothetical protein
MSSNPSVRYAAQKRHSVLPMTFGLDATVWDRPIVRTEAASLENVL